MPPPHNELPVRRRVLVVDPDPAIRALMLAVLRRDGYDAEGARTGDEARAFSQTSAPSAIVIDPRIIGGPILMRDLGLSPSSRLIVVTTPDGLRAPFATGGSIRAVLYKPFDLDDLSRAIAGCCDDGS